LHGSWANQASSKRGRASGGGSAWQCLAPKRPCTRPAALPCVLQTHMYTLGPLLLAHVTHTNSRRTLAAAQPCPSRPRTHKHTPHPLLLRHVLKQLQPHVIHDAHQRHVVGCADSSMVDLWQQA